MMSRDVRTVRHWRARFRFGLLVLGAALLVPFSVRAAQLVPLTLEETVQQADAIVLGTVTGHSSRWGDESRRWMVTDYTVSVEDVLYRSESGDPIGSSIVLTYWGGTIGNESMRASDLRTPSLGERLVVMLRPDWSRRLEFSPVVGFNYGLFSVAEDTGNATRTSPLLLDAGGRQLALAPSGAVTRGVSPTAARAVTLDTFRAWLGANVARIKAAPAPPRAFAPSGDRRLLPLYGKTPAAISPQAAERAAAAAADARMPAAPPDTAAAPAPPTEVIADNAPPAEVTRSPLQYVTLGPKPNVPMVVNNLPDSFAPWSPEDEYQMSKWNYYGDVFRVVATPSGTFAWPNNVFDIDGWISSATLQSVYGSGWGANTIAICFSRWIGGTIVEADIAFNPAFGYTLDDEWVYNGSTAQGFRLVMLHELGHMLGLDHDFSSMAVMNYFPSEFRFFALPYADDAQGLRVVHPSSTVARNDLGVALYYASGSQSVTDASYPGTATSGGSLSVNYYWLENVGTTTIATPTVQWYLTTARNYNAGNPYYYLGTSTYPALAPFTRFTESSVTRTFTIPAYVPTGNYYLAAYIPGGDEGAGQGSFPFSNNYAFSRLRIRVTAPAAAPTLVSPANNSTGLTRTPTLVWNASTGATSYDVYLGTATSPAFYGNTAGTSITVGTLASARRYYWNVVARNSAGASPHSATYTFTTEALPTPSPVSPANNATGVSRAPTLSWTASAGATAYDVYFGTSATPGFHASVTATSLTLAPLNPGTRYYWYVVARNSTLSSFPSLTYTFVTSALPNLVHQMFRHSASGDIAAWVLNGLSLTQSSMVFSGLPVAWRIEGLGDLDGDRKTDIVFRHTGSGDVAAWLMNGTAIRQAGVIASGLPLGWRIERIGDLNGDGKADLVFRDGSSGDVAAWLMNGLTATSMGTIQSALSVAWQIAALSDLNGDGRADLVFRNTQTGDVAGWLMNGLSRTQANIVYPGLPAAWRIEGAGDLNGDNKADLMLRNTQTGDVATWLMNGLVLAQGVIIYPAVPLSWELKTIGDLDSDGKADLVFWNNQSGDVAGWLMNGAAVRQMGLIGTVPAVWQFSGLGDLDYQ